MSRILRRPMFRGGPVDSYGTGIASGLIDKPKRGLVDEPGGYAGEVRTGGDLLRNVNTRFDPFYQNMNMDQLRAFQSLGMGNPFRSTKDMPGRFKNAFTFKEPARGDSLVDKIISSAPIVQEQEKFEEDVDKNRQILDNKEFFSGDVDEVIKQSTPVNMEKGPPGGGDSNMFLNPNNNQEQSTEISVEDQITQQAELFDKLFSKNMEAKNKERLKKARIQDISDVGLDIFARSTKPGADVKTMLGEAAERMVDKPSRTEVLQAKIDDQEDKRYQTSVALAVNDYIAGKRSKEKTDQLLAKLGLDEQSRKDLIDYRIKKEKETITFNTRIEEASKSFGKAKKHISVIQSAVDKTYGDGKFKGKLPEDQSKLIEGGIYVGDGDEKGTYKILYEIDATGTPKFLRNIF